MVSPEESSVVWHASGPSWPERTQVCPRPLFQSVAPGVRSLGSALSSCEARVVMGPTRGTGMKMKFAVKVLTRAASGT